MSLRDRNRNSGIGFRTFREPEVRTIVLGVEADGVRELHEFVVAERGESAEVEGC